MSGKKASDVNDLLRNGEKTRTASVNALKRSIDGCAESIKAHSEAQKSFKKAVKDFNAELSETAKRELGESAVKDFEKQLADWKTAAQSMSEKVVKNKYMSGYAAIMEEYSAADRQADAVRAKLKQKQRKDGEVVGTWYCDREYADAGRIGKKYKQIAQKGRSLMNECDEQTKTLNSETAVLKNRAAQALEFKKRIAEMNSEAEKLVQVRKEAQSAKTKVNELFNKIDKAKAKRFMGEAAYAELESSVQSYAAKDNSSVVQLFGEMTDKLMSFAGLLDMKYAAFVEEKKAVQAGFESVAERFTNKVYTHPEDEYRRKDARRPEISLTEFMDTYLSGKGVAEANALMNGIKSAIKADDLEKAKADTEKLEALQRELAETAIKSHEDMMNSISNMLAIQRTMLDMGYDVGVKKLSGNVIDGYRIDCTVNDERISFDKVSVKDGELTIDIDHKEAVSGTCHKTWQDISRKLIENDIIIEDITKDGVSVLNRQRTGAAMNETKNTTMLG